MCCSDGKIFLQTPNEPPIYICKLLNDKKFLDNIRAYNSALQFTSMGINLDIKYANNLKGQFTFRIHGSIYHRIGSLLPNSIDNSKFLQLFFHDTDKEIDNRLLNFNGLDRNILLNIQKIMHNINPYVKSLKQFASEVILNPSLKLIIKSDSKIDRRKYNKPVYLDKK
jgi:hypothetical protein